MLKIITKHLFGNFHLTLQSIAYYEYSKMKRRVLASIKSSIYPWLKSVGLSHPLVFFCMALVNHFLSLAIMRLIPVMILIFLGCGCSSLTSKRQIKSELWKNSLGMSFAKVPVVSLHQPHEASASSVLFAIDETPASHVHTFRSETGTIISGLDQKHKPARWISWTEAKAFCDWLTKKERASGILRSDQHYRLPSDHEWSCAVGIGHLESDSDIPEGKNQKVLAIYPWGKEWPPPAFAGNLAGMESSRYLPENHILGFRDRFRGNQIGSRTSTQNRLGIYDLSGNLWEWCEDRFRPNQDWRVLRGGSWMTARAETLLSSHRTHDPENYRSDSVGFRCVLDP